VGGETRLQADADLSLQTYHGDRLLAFQKSPHRKQTKVVEADARTTQPGFRLTPSFKGAGRIVADPNGDGANPTYGTAHESEDATSFEHSLPFAKEVTWIDTAMSFFTSHPISDFKERRA
jgi:hypothetical protein